MPARKKAPARKRAAKRKAPVRRSKKQTGPSKNILVFLLLFSLGCLAVSIYMLIEEKKKKPELSEMGRKVQELVEQNPDADVFQVGEPPVKKK